MKLSEVIKAIEDGNKSTFNCGNWVAYSDNEGVMHVCYGSEKAHTLPLYGWEEVKPPRQWSDDEKKIINIFNWAKWITKTEIGDVLLTEEKPMKCYFDFAVNAGKMIIINKETLESAFSSTVTKEESPVYIRDMKE